MGQTGHGTQQQWTLFLFVDWKGPTLLLLLSTYAHVVAKNREGNMKKLTIPEWIFPVSADGGNQTRFDYLDTLTLPDWCLIPYYRSFFLMHFLLLSVALLGILFLLLSVVPSPCTFLSLFLSLAAYHRHPHQPSHQRPAPLLCYHCHCNKTGRTHTNMFTFLGNIAHNDPRSHTNSQPQIHTLYQTAALLSVYTHSSLSERTCHWICLVMWEIW